MNGRTFSRYLRKRGRSHCHQYTVYIAEWSYIYLGIKHFVEFILLTDVRGMGMSRWGWKRGWVGVWGLDTKDSVYNGATVISAAFDTLVYTDSVVQ